jgi:glutamyl-tRNA synthetase
LFTPDAELAIDDALWQKIAATDRLGELYDAVLAHLAACDWTLEGIDPRPVVTGLELKVKPAMKALYTAIEGRESGLPLFDSILLLGRESTVTRLRAARARLA